VNPASIPAQVVAITHRRQANAPCPAPRRAEKRTVWSDRPTIANVMGANALRFLGLAPGQDGSTPANLERVRRHFGARLPAWL
jgi:hypothetical protein